MSMESSDKVMVWWGVLLALCVLAFLLLVGVKTRYGNVDAADCERACGSGRVLECGKTIRCVEAK